MSSPDIRYRVELETTAEDLHSQFQIIATRLDDNQGRYVFARKTATVGTGFALASAFLTVGLSAFGLLGGLAAAATVFVVSFIYQYIIDKEELTKVETMWATFCSLYKKMYMEGEDQGSTPEAKAEAKRKMVEIGVQLAELAARGTLVHNLVLGRYTVIDIIKRSLQNNCQGDICRSLAEELEKLIESSEKGKTKEKQKVKQNVRTSEHKMHQMGFISENQQQCTQVERNSDKKKRMDTFGKYQREIILSEINIIVPQQNVPNASLLESTLVESDPLMRIQFFKKETSIADRNVLTSYSATEQTQTDDVSYKRNIPKPIVCLEWQIKATFTSAGGSLSKPHSDVLLTIPPGAVEKGMYRDVYMAVCTDIPRIHEILNMPDVYIASPLVEFWTPYDATFKKTLHISLPHCLNLSREPVDAQVYRITNDFDGKIIVQQLLIQPTTKKEADINSQKSTFYLKNDKIVCISTASFSAYVCVACGYKNSETCEVCVIGCGTNKPQTDGSSAGIVRMAVWDERFSVKDFQPENSVSPEQTLKLPITEHDKSPNLRLKLRLPTGSIWRQLQYEDNTTQPTEQRVDLGRILHCSGERCRRRPHPQCHSDQSAVWQLETTGSPVKDPMLRCTVLIMYCPDRRVVPPESPPPASDTWRVPMDITPSMEPEPHKKTSPPVIRAKNVFFDVGQSLEQTVSKTFSNDQTYQPHLPLSTPVSQRI